MVNLLPQGERFGPLRYNDGVNGLNVFLKGDPEHDCRNHYLDCTADTSRTPAADDSADGSNPHPRVVFRTEHAIS